MTPTDRLASEIEAALVRAGIHAVVELQAGAVALFGRTDTEASRDAAEDIARSLAPDREVINELEVEDQMPVSVAAFRHESEPAGDLPDTDAELMAEDSQLEADFTDQPLVTSAQEIVDEQDESYFPPTDPVVEPAADTNAAVLGGFAATSLDEVQAEPSASDEQIGDESLEEAVRRELIEDASTTALNIRVSVRNGVVILTGGVEGPEDSEAAEAVAARVPGVRDVVDHITIEALG